MKKLFAIAAIVVASMPAAAQETYENARLLQDDLNGTARYVGMGGAMEALGADISTIGTNPAGLGLFRHSTINGSFGIVAQASAPSFAQGTKTNVSFDQIDQFICFLLAELSVSKEGVYKCRKRSSETSFYDMLAFMR